MRNAIYKYSGQALAVTAITLFVNGFYTAVSAEEAIKTTETTTLTQTQLTPAADNRPVSRLSRLMLNQETMYLPTKLVIGTNNRFLVKGKPGNDVMLYVSPKGDGYKLPNGLALKVGETHESLGGKIPENGILTLEIPVPNEQDWAGHFLFVDAITWTQPDYADVKQIQLLDATGRRTTDNGLLMTPQVRTTGGSLIMPSMPGMPAGALQQLTQTSEILGSNDKRRKDLIYDGDRNPDTILDRNSLLNRNGFGGSPLQQVGP